VELKLMAELERASGLVVERERAAELERVLGFASALAAVQAVKLERAVELASGRAAELAAVRA
jgi:hypothetical protein